MATQRRRQVVGGGRVVARKSLSHRLAKGISQPDRPRPVQYAFGKRLAQGLAPSSNANSLSACARQPVKWLCVEWLCTAVPESGEIHSMGKSVEFDSQATRVDPLSIRHAAKLDSTKEIVLKT
jgi:hypothetical protein